jgi:hypothetical protein
MKLFLITFAVFCCLIQGCFAGSDTKPILRIIPVDIVQHSEAGNLVEDFNRQVDATLNETIDGLSRILNSHNLEPQDSLVQVDELRKDSKFSIDTLLAQLLISLAQIIGTDVDTFIQAINEAQNLPEDIAKIIEFGRVAAVRGQATKLAIEGRTHEFIIEFLNKV